MTASIPLPSEIAVEETLDGARYTLRGKSSKQEASGCAGLFLLLFGCAFAGFAALWIAVAVYGMIQTDEALILRILFPLFGLPFLLVGFGIIFAGLYSMIGREEIVVSRNTLRSISRAGVLRWTRRRRIDEITLLRCGSKRRRSASFAGGRTLEVECRERKSLHLLGGYPINWQQALAVDLGERLGVEVESSTALHEAMGLVETSSEQGYARKPTRDQYQDREVALEEPNRALGFASTSSSLGCMIVFALLWNGITGAVIFGMLVSKDSDIPIFAWIIMSVFVLVGLLFLAKAIHIALAKMKLHPAKVIISRYPLHIGEEFTISFSQESKGNVQITSVRGKLLCRESATYRRGTDTHTARHNVYEEEFAIAEESAADSFRDVTGEVTLRIPDDAMHSFEADRNQITWVLETRTDVPNWPDYIQYFLLEVLPLRLIDGDTSAASGGHDGR